MSVIRAVVEKIKAANVPFVIAATGAGSGLQDLLWRVPGISSVLLNAVFPYASESSTAFAGAPFDAPNASPEAAVDLAMAAYLQAETILAQRGDKRASIGLGLSASVASNEIHKGDHRIHLAVVTGDRCWIWNQSIPKGSGPEIRRQDGVIADQMGLQLLEFAATGAFTPWVGWNYALKEQDADLLLETRFWRRPLFCTDGRRVGGLSNHIRVSSGRPILFPGSFNPPHTGHRAMATEIQDIVVKPVVFNINADSVHKPPLSVQAMLGRLAQVRAQEQQGANPHDVLFSHGQPLFIDKVAAYPGQSFLVGSDTLERLLDPKWGVDPLDVLETFQKYRAHFYVFSRTYGGQHVRAHTILDRLADRPGLNKGRLTAFRSLFEDLQGRWDVSSSELRNETPLREPYNQKASDLMFFGVGILPKVETK